MAKIEEKFAASEFLARTQLTRVQVMAAADEAAERAGNLFTDIKRAEPIGENAIQYIAKTAGMVKAGVFVVHYAPATEQASATVRLEANWFMTTQSTILFIPIGPKDSNALGPFKSFSRQLQAAVGTGN